MNALTTRPTSASATSTGAMPVPPLGREQLKQPEDPKEDLAALKKSRAQEVHRPLEGNSRTSNTRLCNDATGVHGLFKRGVVALVLIGVRLSKQRDGAIERVVRAEVARDGDRVS